MNISKNEKIFIEKSALKYNLRVDGRMNYELRNIKILEFDDNKNLVQVNFGDTKCLVSIESEIGCAYQDHPNEGRISIYCHFSVTASNNNIDNYKSRIKKENEISKILEKIIRDTNAIDLESLCIINSEKVWIVKINVHLIDHNGNLIDCSVLATIIALIKFRRPYIDITKKDNTNMLKIYDTDIKQPISLNIYHFPLCLTLAFLKGNKAILADPLLKEEIISTSSITFSIDDKSNVYMIQKHGGEEIDIDEFTKSLKLAESKTKEMHEIINKYRND